MKSSPMPMPMPMLLLAALAVAASGVHAAQPWTQRDVLDLLFKSGDLRARFGEDRGALKAMAMAEVAPLLDRWRSQAGSPAALTPPWHNATESGTLQRAVDSGMDKVVAMLRKLIENMAEPLKIESVNLNRSSPLVEVVGYVKDVSIAHLSTFEVQDLEVDLLTVSATLKFNFEKLDAHGEYDVDATASQQLHVFGDGHFDVRLYKPSVEVAVQLGYNDEVFNVEELQFYVKMSKLKVIMSNFLGGEEVGDLVCGIISDVGPAFLDEYREDINKIVSSELKETINAVLATLPINKIIDWISGSGNISS